MKINSLTFQRIFLTLFLSFMAAHAHAGRPLNTDDTGTVAPKVLELEIAYEYVDAPDIENNLSAVFTTGILSQLDLGVEIPYQFINLEDAEDQSGLSDLGITTKWNFYQNEDLFDTTLSFNYKSDNGNDDKSLGTGEAEYTVLMILTKATSSSALHLNLGPTLIKDADDVLNYNIAGEWAANERLTLVGELFGAHDFHGNFDANPMSALVGAAIALNDNVVGDLGLTFGISESEPDFKVTTGVTIAFGSE